MPPPAQTEDSGDIADSHEAGIGDYCRLIAPAAAADTADCPDDDHDEAFDEQREDGREALEDARSQMGEHGLDDGVIY